MSVPSAPASVVPAFVVIPATVARVPLAPTTAARMARSASRAVTTKRLSRITCYQLLIGRGRRSVRYRAAPLFGGLLAEITLSVLYHLP